MPAQKGKDLLLKLDDGTGAFVSVAGLRARQITFNSEAVDVTSADSAGRWRELLAGAAVRRAAVTGAGVFRDEAADALVRQTLFDDAIRTWQVIIPSFGIVQGPFHIASLDYRGDHAGEVTFDLALESAGALTFTAI
ncbi:phage major tail protein, TP901-1 family [Alsobacter soli]|uniref:Phage major tail protein, TP901-1 family n=1 Tax=Alsobacter soli TaxID=2109933 RepID=A0A2T1HS80_9HYPH|nr:phage major tail protein, TP901-1 family [Alsobacter soli]PSC04523.1 phage major tail protein, TP901-1 family [Alsobacter soli]